MTALLTKTQVAEILAVHKNTIDRYCNARKLRFYRISAGKRFDPADVQAFLDSYRVGSLTIHTIQNKGVAGVGQ